MKAKKALNKYNENRKNDLKKFLYKYSLRTQNILVPFFGLQGDTNDPKNRNTFIQYCSKINNLVEDALENYKSLDVVPIDSYCMYLLAPHLKKMDPKNGYYYLLILSYYLIKDNDSFIDGCLRIFQQESICQKNYEDLLALKLNVCIHPKENDICKRVCSVLLGMGRSSIQNKLKKVIYSSSNLDFSKLETINLNEYNAYLEKKKQSIQELAYVFIMDYMQDPFFLASFSVYTLCMEPKIASFITEKKEFIPSNFSISSDDLTPVTSINDLFNTFSFENLVYIDNVHFDTWTIEKQREYVEFLTMLYECIVKIQRSERFIFNEIKEDDSSIKDELEMKYQSLQDMHSQKQKVLLSLQKEDDRKKEEIQDKIDEKYKSEMNELYDEIERKKQKILLLKSEQNETKELRNSLFMNECEEEKIENSSLLNISNQISISFVGGHENLVKNLKQKYPNMKYIEGDNENINEESISHSDVVFFFYKHMNHNVYEQIMKILLKNHIRYGYVSSTNLERLEQEMIQIISKM